MNAQQGVGLIEVLVALLITSVGLLGFASLQAANLNVGDTAWSRSSATVLAADLVDRARVNPGQFATGGYDIAFGASSGSNVDCRVTSCTPAQLRNYDLNQWLDRVAQMLPAGQGQARRDTSLTPAVLIVELRWFDRLAQATQTLELRGQP